MLLIILNAVFPGAGLLWRKQTLQAIAYAVSFGFLNVFRSDVGAVWAIFVWILAQIHFHRVRVAGSERGLSRNGKLVVWLTTIGILTLFLAAYGPFSRHFPSFPAFLILVISLVLPAVLVTVWLEPRSEGGRVMRLGFFRKTPRSLEQAMKQGEPVRRLADKFIRAMSEAIAEDITLDMAILAVAVVLAGLVQHVEQQNPEAESYVLEKLQDQMRFMLKFDSEAGKGTLEDYLKERKP